MDRALARKPLGGNVPCVLQDALDGFDLYRLCDKVTHACLKALGLVCGECIGGQGYDVNGIWMEVMVGAELEGGVTAVHDGHFHVHEDEVVIGLLGLFYGFLSVVCQIHVRIAQALQSLFDDLKYQECVERVPFG